MNDKGMKEMKEMKVDDKKNIKHFQTANNKLFNQIE